MAKASAPPVAGLRLQPRPKYVALTLCAVQQAVAYRGTTLLSLAAGLIWVAVPYYVWRTVFATEPAIAGLSWDEMRTYVVLAYAVGALLSFYPLARMANSIRTGEVAMQLVRPLDYLGAQLAQLVGTALVEGFLSGGIALVLSFLLIHVTPPRSPLAGAVFLVSVGLGFLVKFLLSYLVALVCFWTTSALGLIWAHNAVVSLLSGALVPLDLFPGWLRAAVLAAPFHAIVYTPVRVYLGKLEGAAMWQALAVQALWVCILWALARMLWAASIRKLNIQGG